MNLPDDILWILSRFCEKEVRSLCVAGRRCAGPWSVAGRAGRIRSLAHPVTRCAIYGCDLPRVSHLLIGGSVRDFYPYCGEHLPDGVRWGFDCYVVGNERVAFV